MNEAVRIVGDRRPLVRARPNRWAPWVFAAVTALGAVLLYASLESARADRLAGDGGDTAEVGAARPLPDLVIPSYYETESHPGPVLTSRPAVRLIGTVPANQIVSPPTVIYRPAPARAVQPPPEPSPMPYAPVPVAAPPPPEFGAAQSTSGITGTRARAEKLANPSYTVAQGALIPAVLETALDSTRAGPVRAMVSRDVRSFDRERLLIPRGSKLIGEYQADVTAGQNRASVIWTRLIRPDGVTIDLRSPAADGLGRAGIAGRINNHTMRRIGDALLQTLIGVGSGLTQRAVTQPVIVVPAGTPAPSINLTAGNTIQPTLTVRQGARISVFVARDLDFSAVDQQP